MVRTENNCAYMLLIFLPVMLSVLLLIIAATMEHRADPDYTYKRSQAEHAEFERAVLEYLGNTQSPNPNNYSGTASDYNLVPQIYR
jgi:hypothetical protein